LVARKDDWTAATGQKKNGHGIGLSQVGAKYAASQGVSFRVILSFYYPYTTLKEIGMELEDDRKVLEDIHTRVKIALETIKEGL